MAIENAPAGTDSEGEAETPSNSKQRRKSASVAAKQLKEENDEVVDEDGEGEGGGTGDDEDDEEEYEIEKILSAERNRFGKRWGFFVKWKGYSEEHNSWVDEHDAGNADQLIKEYWERTKEAERKKKGRSSLGASSSASVPAGRSVKSGSSKRKAQSDSDVEMLDAEDDEDDDHAKKKPRKSNGTSTSARAASTKRESARSVSLELGEVNADGFMEITSNKKYMKMSSWTSLIESVDTVERDDNDGEIYLFFTLKNNQGRSKAPTKICRQKFSELMIDFYESHLRWKAASDTEEDVTVQS